METMVDSSKSPTFGFRNQSLQDWKRGLFVRADGGEDSVVEKKIAVEKVSADGNFPGMDLLLVHFRLVPL